MNPLLMKILESRLKTARIEPRELPHVRQIQLYLINDDIRTGKLPAQELESLLEKPPFWTFCWASGQALAGWILNNPHYVRGRRVLDFGCGSGVVAIAAKLAGAREAVAFDSDPDAVVAAEENSALNRVSIKTVNRLEEINFSFDVVLAADILYDRENYPLLEQFMKWAPVVIVADSRVKEFPHRSYQLVDEVRETTFPDLGESHEFTRVKIFSKEGG